MELVPEVTKCNKICFALVLSLDYVAKKGRMLHAHEIVSVVNRFGVDASQCVIELYTMFELTTQSDTTLGGAQ